MAEPFDPERFCAAQDAVFADVLAELAAGRKRSHWMWFIFPQLAGLGHSATARHFALDGVAQARAYWHHPVLGERLRRCCTVLAGQRGRSAQQVFGDIDTLKLCSCLTLFEQAVPDETLFASLLDRLFDGRRDAATLQLLADRPG